MEYELISEVNCLKAVGIYWLGQTI
ncbi:uncharacterized protein METZ01_LOCUS212598 [marine metagenome]|uniref:Uncharacterized protein n=1 Tax=marine metagenome TaxID=408172 RepID=A0A382FBR1_9ZZZZ